MKLWPLFALLLALPLAAQVSNPSIILVTTAPSGACTAGLPNQQVASTGTQYSCQSGTWGAIGGGGSSGFPIVLGSTSIAASSTTTALAGFTSLATVGTLDNGSGSSVLPSGTATSLTNYDSGSFFAESSYWNGAAAANDFWFWDNDLGMGTNPATTLTFHHTGTSGATAVSIPFPLTATTFNGVPLTATGSVSNCLTQAGTYATCGGGSPCPLVDATNICLTQAPYYASPAGLTTTTAASISSGSTSTTVASCSTFTAGNGILIPGAGAAGVNFYPPVVSCTGTTLTWTGATSTTVTSVTIQHDESAAFNAAVTALNTAGSGTIWLPDGTYLANGPLQQTSGANAIIPMPVITNYTSPLVNITISGFDPVFNGFGPFASIQTSLNTAGANLLGGYAPGGAYPPFTNVDLKLEHLVIIGPTNTASVMVNATSIIAFQSDDILVKTVAATLPTATTGGGIFLPAIANAFQNTVERTNVAGFGTNVILTEHTQVGQLYSQFGINCVAFDNGTNGGSLGTYNGNSVSVDYMWAFNCTNGVVGRSNVTVLDVQNADFELNTTDILDSSNVLRGELNFLCPYSSASSPGCPAHNQLNITGATNLLINPLYDRAGVSLFTPSGGGFGAGLNFVQEGTTRSPNASISNPSAGILSADTSTLGNAQAQENIKSIRFLDAAGTVPGWVQNIAGVELGVSHNLHFNGANFVYDTTAFASSIIAGPANFIFSVCPVGSSGSTAAIGGACTAQYTALDGSGANKTWFNSQTASPSWPSNASLVLNPSANWYVDFSGNETNNSVTAGNVTDSALTTGLVGNTSGLLGTITALPNGTTATTQSVSDNSTKIATTAFVAAATYLSGTTASIGGSLLAGAGSCTTGTATVTGVGSGNFPVGSPVAVSASDGSLPNGLVTLAAAATATNTVTVSICAIAAVTPTAKTYNVSVF